MSLSVLVDLSISKVGTGVGFRNGGPGVQENPLDDETSVHLLTTLQSFRDPSRRGSKRRDTVRRVLGPEVGFN